ncbi:ATP-binding cassette domain-containing protein [Enterocloster clostridioformis]
MRRVPSLSGGERRRLYLLRILMEAPSVILLDVNSSPLNECVSCIA